MKPATTKLPIPFLVVMLVLLRLLMGVGEATFYPSALSLLSRRGKQAAGAAKKPPLEDRA